MKKKRLPLGLDEKTLDLVSEHCMDGILILDSECVVVYMSDTYRQILNLDKEYCLGKKVWEIENLDKSTLPQTMKTREETRGLLFDVAEEAPGVGVHELLYVDRVPLISGDDEVEGAMSFIKSMNNTNEVISVFRQVKEESRFYQQELKRSGITLGFDNLVTQDAAVLEIIKTAKRTANSDIPILLLGETGTGKEVVANAIHAVSARRSRPFVKVNCAALPEHLIESELFGYEEGAFTGAKKGGKKGKFELADKGTIFLDEIGELPMQTQAKLLRVLQDGVIDRVGASEPVSSDFRLIAATNRNLSRMVEQGEFREDLYYRLSVLPIEMPPLRRRRGDIPLLIQRFLAEVNHRYGTEVAIEKAAVQYIAKQPLPGNVRELKNIIERSYIMRQKDGMITMQDLEFLGEKNEAETPGKKAGKGTKPEGAEKAEILRALDETGHNCAKAAQKLGISRMTLYRKIDKYGIALKRG
ncbi:sigma 54-interacting transcriptional regulator [Ruminococcaceae bacterium OttesenSCG-928-O06]|nr:sigma 54-interacting transcriptional regulator [Ruminococcaceae bacterium OttesenSCG-928-O06]